MPFDIGAAAQQVSTGLLGSAFGLLTAGINDRRQINQQTKLNELAYQTNNKMAESDYNRQIRLFNETGYGAQKQQMIEAGLNPGLLYGMGGSAGGSTAAAHGQGVSTGQAPTGGGEMMGMISQQLQMGMMKAQIEVMKSQANKNNTEAQKAAGVDTQLAGTQIEKLKAETSHETAKQIYTEVQTDISEIQRDYQKNTLETNIAQAENNLRTSENELQRGVRRNYIEAATLPTAINTIRAEYATILLQQEYIKQSTKESAAGTAAKYESIDLMNAQSDKMITERIQGFQQLELQGGLKTLQDRKQAYDQLINDVSESTKLGVETVTKILQATIVSGSFK